MNNKLKIFLFICAIFVFYSAMTSKRAEVISKKTNKEIIKSNIDSCILLENSFDTILFNPKTNCANWVKWKITIDKLHTKRKADRDNYPFTADTCVPKINRVTTEDYNKSGYDRGHMNPAADNTFSKIAMKNCMLMTNIIPQTKELNRGPWKSLEEKCRSWAEKYDVIYVVSGPIYTSNKYEYIGKNHKIAIPDKNFKVIMTKKKGYEKAIGFIFDNSKNPETILSKAAVSVDSVEKITGYDFFEWLPDELENKIESKYNFTSWNLWD